MKKFYIIFSLFIVVFTLLINEANVYYPIWQNNYILSRYSKINEIEEHQPYRISLDSLKTFPELENQKASLLTSRNQTYLYFYKSSIISSEMIEEGIDRYNKYIAALWLFSGLILLIVILLDCFASGLYANKVKPGMS